MFLHRAGNARTSGPGSWQEASHWYFPARPIIVIIQKTKHWYEHSVGLSPLRRPQRHRQQQLHTRGHYLRTNSSWHEWSGKFLTALQMSMDGAFLIYTLSLPLAVPSRVVKAFHPVDDSWLSNMDVSYGIFDRWSVVDRMEGPYMHVWYKTMQKGWCKEKPALVSPQCRAEIGKKMICQLEWSS